MHRIQVILSDVAYNVLKEFKDENECPSNDAAMEKLLIQAEQWVIQK